MANKIVPLVDPAVQGNILSPVWCITADSTTTIAGQILDLSAWAGSYVSVVFVGDDGWIAFNNTSSVGSFAAATRDSSAQNTSGNCMWPMIEGAEKQMVVSLEYPYLIHRTATGTATISVHRA